VLTMLVKPHLNLGGIGEVNSTKLKIYSQLFCALPVNKTQTSSDRTIFGVQNMHILKNPHWQIYIWNSFSILFVLG